MELQRLQKNLQYEFNDLEILSQALTHRSAGKLNNERLEFLGDAILGFEVADQLFQQYPHASEGELSRSRAQLVKRETLAAVARQINLGEYLILGTGELRSGGQNRDSILADGIEALIAAVYLDSNMSTARSLVRHLLADHLAQARPHTQQKDAKTRLQEFLQARGKGLPQYDVVSISGAPHDQRFVVRCEVVDLDLSATAEGQSRRKAEQKAATSILITLGEI